MNSKSLNLKAQAQLKAFVARRVFTKTPPVVVTTSPLSSSSPSHNQRAFSISKPDSRKLPTGRPESSKMQKTATPNGGDRVLVTTVKKRKTEKTTSVHPANKKSSINDTAASLPNTKTHSQVPANNSKKSAAQSRREAPKTAAKTVGASTKNFWLFKSEPHVYSFDQLKKEKNATTNWEGVRNYQARGYLRDQIKVGDGVLFYHSSCKHPAIVGSAIVTKEGYIDDTAKDSKSNWYQVDIQADQTFSKVLTLDRIKTIPALSEMALLRTKRLSVMPVKPQEWDTIIELAK